MKMMTLDRIRAEYREMPGMRLSPEQIARLCGIGDDLCHAYLDALVKEGFLTVTSGGMYIHPRDDLRIRPRHAAAKY
jgi:hypothetical protein